MKKSVFHSGTVLAVLLVLYVLIAFLLPFEHGSVFWCSFVFTLLSFLIAGASLYLGFVKQPDIKSKFYGFPILKIGVIYAAVQLITGLVFMVIGQNAPVWIPVLLYAIAMGAAVIGLVSADAVVDEIRVQDDNLRRNVSLMRALQSKANQLPSQCSDAETTELLKKFCEDLRFSDPVSSAAIADAEADLAAVVDELQQAVVDGDQGSVEQLCRKASILLAERNRLCKLNK